MKHKRQQLTALSLYQQSYTFRKQIFRKSSNTQETAFKVGRQLLPQIAKHSYPYHRLSRYHSHRFYFTWRYSSQFSFHDTSNYMNIGIRLKFMKGCTCICEPQMHMCICTYDKYAHMQGVNVNLQKRINEDTVIKTDNAKHWDQTKYRNSCMYIIGP